MIDETLPESTPGGKKPGAAKRFIDWDALSIHYRAGIRSLKDIGAEFGVSDAAIIKKARKEDWTRDLNGKIRAKAEKLVSARMVRATVSAETKITEKLTIDTNAEAIVSVRLAHRTDIRRSRTLAMKLLEELECQTHGIADFEYLGELMRTPDDRDKLNELYQKVISLPGRTKTMKDLGDTLKTLVGLERQAFSIDDGTSPDELGSSRQFTVTYRASPHATD